MLYSSLRDNPKASHSIMLLSLYPVITLILSAVFFNQYLSLGKIIGIMIMIGGALLVSWS
jgi:drug/metabolite transporter (DMT)-like permease